MIEVEKKIKITPFQIEEIKKRSKLVKRSLNSDTYYDKEDFSLTMKNIWLRKRNGSFELKIGLKKGRTSVDQYLEIDNPDEISSRLKLKRGLTLALALEDSLILPFAEIATNRESYKLGDFHIDIDEAFSEGFSYLIAEIELMVSSEDEVNGAEERILRLAQELGCPPAEIVKAKITAYLEQKSKKHFEALVRAKVI